MHLLLRRTEGYFNGRLDLKHVVKDTQTVSDIINLWDLKLPYLAFRKRLRDIAEQSLTAQKFESVIPWSDSSAVSALHSNSWLLPMDEDDWLHPDFVGIFAGKQIPDKVNFVTWGVIRKEADGGGPKDQKKFVESCGYAVRVPTEWQFITNHMHISEQPSKACLHIKSVLAVRNETPASIGFMVKRGSPRKAIELSIGNRLHDQKRLYLWTKPQADAYYDLLEEALS